MTALLRDLQQEFATTLKAIEDLQAKANRTPDETTELDGRVEHAKELKADITRAKELLDLNAWGGQPSGALPLAGASACVLGMLWLVGWISERGEGAPAAVPAA